MTNTPQTAATHIDNIRAAMNLGDRRAFSKAIDAGRVFWATDTAMTEAEYETLGAELDGFERIEAMVKCGVRGLLG